MWLASINVSSHLVIRSPTFAESSSPEIPADCDATRPGLASSKVTRQVTGRRATTRKRRQRPARCAPALGTRCRSLPDTRVVLRVAFGSVAGERRSAFDLEQRGHQA